MRRLSPLLPVLTTLALAACSSYKLAVPPANGGLNPSSPIPPSEARICVVRTSVLAVAVTFPTRDNGLLVGATRGPTNFCYLAEPGEHEIAVEADDVEHAKVKVEAGRTYYLKQEVNNVLGYVTCSAVWVEGEAAKGLFVESTNEVLVGVPGEEKLPAPTPYAPAKRSAPVE